MAGGLATAPANSRRRSADTFVGGQPSQATRSFSRMFEKIGSSLRRKAAQSVALLGTMLLTVQAHASEADLKIPDLSAVKFQGVDGRSLLMIGLLVAALGGAFGLWIF